jgi:hypothetical protein
LRKHRCSEPRLLPFEAIKRVACREPQKNSLLVSYELTRDNAREESCGRGGGGVQPWAC